MWNIYILHTGGTSVKRNKAPPNFFKKEPIFTHVKNAWSQGFPGGTVVKNPPANIGNMGLSPGTGRSHMP